MKGDRTDTPSSRPTVLARAFDTSAEPTSLYSRNPALLRGVTPLEVRCLANAERRPHPDEGCDVSIGFVFAESIVEKGFAEGVVERSGASFLYLRPSVSV